MLAGRGRTPTELEPLLSVDAMEGCLMRSMTGADTALCHCVGRTPAITVFPLEPLCVLDGPRTSTCRRSGRVGPVSNPLGGFGAGESGGELKGAMGFGTRVAGFDSRFNRPTASQGSWGVVPGPSFCGEDRKGLLCGTERGAIGDVYISCGDA